MAKNYEGRKENGEGNVRKLPSGKYECVVQSKYINPKTGKPKRIKRVGETEKAAREKAKLDLVAWEKEIERGRDTKINKAKTFGEYMSEYIETEVKPCLLYTSGLLLQLPHHRSQRCKHGFLRKLPEPAQL